MALREAWFGSSIPGESSELSLAPAQEAFLEDLAALLDHLDAPRLPRAEVGAILLRDGLHVVLPLAGAPRASVQLLVREGDPAQHGILGTWHDKGEVWTQVLDADADWRVAGVDESTRAQAVQWVRVRMHRPFVRRSCTRCRVLRSTVWEHTDPASPRWREIRGPDPSWLTGARLDEEHPAGFMDPRP